MSRYPRRRWRLVRRFRAWLGGYFWLPCPVCGQDFGGFECGNNAVEVGGRWMGACRLHEDEVLPGDWPWPPGAKDAP